MTGITVPALLGGVRIDRVVAMLTGVPRSVASELVSGGRVRVDGQVATARSVALPAGAVLEIDIPPVAAAGPGAEPDVAFDVVHQDLAVLVIEKPAALVVHPGAGRLHGTLVSGLLARFPELADLSEVCDPARPGIVHRLDRGTSGLLAVARTVPAYRSLVAQLAARTMTRRYVALVAGHVPEERGVVEAPIGRSGRTPTRMAVSARGRDARTTYTVLRRFDEPLPSSLLELALDTGRTHQIRVHLAAIGHPVVGDERYGRPGSGERLLREPGRLFLHAGELGFEHPVTGAPVRFTSPLPPDLAALVDAAR